MSDTCDNCGMPHTAEGKLTPVQTNENGVIFYHALCDECLLEWGVLF